MFEQLIERLSDGHIGFLLSFIAIFMVLAIAGLAESVVNRMRGLS